MRKFKLIKEYPASDHEGIIVVQKTSGGMYEGYQYNYYSKHVENNPEYWQEVKESDYQILSFSAYFWDGKLATLLPNGKYYTQLTTGGWSLKELLVTGNSVKNGAVKIHSVKRISDGEIFTIGDRAKTITSKGSHNIRQFVIRQRCTGTDTNGNYTYDGIDAMWVNWEENCGGNWLDSTEKVIEKDFEISSYVAKDNPNNITTKRRGAHLHEEYWKIHSVKRLSDGEVFTVGDLVKTPYTDCTRITGFNIEHSTEYFIEISTKCCTGISTGFTRLLNLEKVKNPIFLTHDGKDIFEGDKVWWVRKDSTSIIGRLIVPPGEKFNSDMTAYFLTQEAAEDYIEKNKVLFTTEDGKDIFAGDKVWWVNKKTFCSDYFVPTPSVTFFSDINAYFSTRAAAENYVVQKSHSLSIEDFWEFDSWGGSNIAKSKRLKRLVKERLNLK